MEIVLAGRRHAVVAVAVLHHQIRVPVATTLAYLLLNRHLLVLLLVLLLEAVRVAVRYDLLLIIAVAAELSRIAKLRRNIRRVWIDHHVGLLLGRVLVESHVLQLHDLGLSHRLFSTATEWSDEARSVSLGHGGAVGRRRFLDRNFVKLSNELLILDNLTVHGFDDLTGRLNRAELHLDLLLLQLHVAVLDVLRGDDGIDGINDFAGRVPRHLGCADHDVRRFSTRRLRIHTLPNEVFDCAPSLRLLSPSIVLELKVIGHDGALEVALGVCQDSRTETLLGALWRHRIPDTLDFLEVLVMVAFLFIRVARYPSDRTRRVFEVVWRHRREDAIAAIGAWAGRIDRGVARRRALSVLATCWATTLGATHDAVGP